MDKELERAYDALMQADAAGNKEDAQQIADYIRTLEAQRGVPKGETSVEQTGGVEPINVLIPTVGGAIAGEVVGPMVNKGVEAVQTAKAPTTPAPAAKVAAPSGTPYNPRGVSIEQSVQNWENYSQAQNEAAKRVRREAELHKKYPGFTRAQPPAPPAAAPSGMAQLRAAIPGPVKTAGQFLSGAAQSGVVPWLGRGIAGGAAGYQAADAYNKLFGPEKDIVGGGLSAIGALGAGASFFPHPVARYGGTAISAGAEGLNQYLNYLKRKAQQPAATPQPQQEQMPVPMKEGGLVHLAGGKSVIANEALNLIKKTLESGKSGKRLARESEYIHKITPTHQFSEPKKVSIQDLQNSVLVGVPGDRSLTGKMVHEVNAVPLTKPVEQFGGPLYGLQQADLGNPNFWASQKGAASSMQNKAARAMQQHNKPVYGMYAAMAPDSSNYALHHLETLLNQVPAMDPAKSQIKGFDKMVREKYPAFAGIMDPDVMQQLKTDSKLRKFIADRMNKTTVADLYGLPSGEATLHAITEPALRDVATGTTGFAVGKLDPFAKLTASKHPTYSTNIPGEFQGQMIAQLPWEVYFPDVAKKIAANPKQAKHSWGTFKMGEFNQPVTQEMVDRIAPIEELILGKKEGGSTTPAWQRKEGKSPSGGLNALGRASYKRETGGTLKAPQPEGGSRKKSFCARMGGMKKKLTSSKTANDPDSRINKALRKWKC